MSGELLLHVAIIGNDLAARKSGETQKITALQLEAKL